MRRCAGVFAVTLATVALLPSRSPPFAEPQSSPRMEGQELHRRRAVAARHRGPQAASDDTKERNRDEALFWLAHSLHQARDLAGAVETIAELERNYPASRWVKPARSLRVELAQKLHRDDVLWWTAPPPHASDAAACRSAGASRDAGALSPAAARCSAAGSTGSAAGCTAGADCRRRHHRLLRPRSPEPRVPRSSASATRDLRL